MLLAQAPADWTSVVPSDPSKPGSGCEILDWDGALKGSPSSSSNPGAPTIQCLEAVFANIISVVMTLAGLAFFVMLVIGSIRFLTSSGDPKATEAARKTMTSALLGLVLLAGSYLILRILSNFTGYDLLKFDIPYIPI